MPVVHLALKPGHAVGELAEGEDARAIIAAAVCVREEILTGALTPLVHGDVTGRERDQEIAQQIELLRMQRLKRYVIPVETDSGPRILKLREVTQPWRAVGTSRARQEHYWHARAQALRIAATETRGFLELRRGPWLVRGVQVQTVLSPQLVSLEEHLRREIQHHGRAAVDFFAEHLAHAHELKFFHADLKGFHAFVTDVRGMSHGPSRYRLLWSDFGRVGFRISSRRRLINLYQALRFVLPEDAATQRQFVNRYCKVSGWYRDCPGSAYSRVMRTLERKRRTHPSAPQNPWTHSYDPLGDS
ncbi:MAG: hypothetical protein AAF605_03070 [Myxococcota bacterium]